MKKIYSLLFIAAVLLMSCDPDDPEFESVDKSQITDIWNEIEGPETVISGTKPEFEASPRSGSSFDWTISVDGYSATVYESADNEFIMEGVFEQFRGEDTVSAVVTVVETTEWGVSESFEYSFNVAPFTNSIDGSDVVVSGTEGEFSLTEHPGSTYEWSLSEVDNASLSSTSGYSTTIVTEKNSEDVTATLSVTETPADGPSLTLTMSITISRYCDYDATTWAGVYYCNEPGYGTYSIELAQDEDDENTFESDNFWDYSGTPYYVFDPESFDVTMPEQTIVMGGTEYTVSGTGEYDQCENSFYVDYELYDDAGDLVEENTHTFTKK